MSLGMAFESNILFIPGMAIIIGSFIAIIIRAIVFIIKLLNQ